MIFQLDILWYTQSHPPGSSSQLPTALHNSYPRRFHGSPHSPLLVFGRKLLERHMQLLFNDSLIYINESIFMLYIWYCRKNNKIYCYIFDIVMITIKSLKHISQCFNCWLIEICNGFYKIWTLDRWYLPSLPPPSVMSSWKLWF